MKKIVILFALFCSSLGFYGCDTDDEGFFNSEFLILPNLVSLPNQTQYNLNDELVITATINNLQPIPNSISLLDIRKSTGNADNFDFTYVLEKLEGQNWETVVLTDNDIEVTSGSAFVGDFVLAFAEYDATQNSYFYNGGIILKSTGQYRLSFGYNSLDVQNAELRSNSNGNNLVLNITSPVTNLDAMGYFNFTVN